MKSRHLTDEELEAEEAVKLVEGVLHVMRSAETLVSLVAHMINVYGSKDVEVRARLQKAHNEYAEGKKLLEDIDFFEKEKATGYQN